MPIADAELFGVTDTTATITFKTVDRDGSLTPMEVQVVARSTAGDHAVTSGFAPSGPEPEDALAHLRIEGLWPETEYSLELTSSDGRAVADPPYLPAAFRTLATPPGEVVATIATVSDLHYGEEVAGLGPTGNETPQFHAADEQPPYWAVTNAGVIDDINATGVDVVLVKGDITGEGHAHEFALARDDFGRLTAPWHAVLGNHDCMQAGVDGLGILGQADDPVREIPTAGCLLALLETAVPGAAYGALPPGHREQLESVIVGSTGPVLVFGHHHVTRPDKDPANLPGDSPGTSKVFGIARDDSRALLELIARHENVHGYSAGHTHRNRLRTFPTTRDVPFVEVGATKEYPAAWAYYRIHTGGYLHEVRRASAAPALLWADRTKEMFYGLYRPYAFGSLEARCFTREW